MLIAVSLHWSEHPSNYGHDSPSVSEHCVVKGSKFKEVYSIVFLTASANLLIPS